MKTLLERLKPEYAAALESEREKFSGACNLIERELAANHYVTKLTVETACTMRIYLGGEGLSDPWSYFEDDDDE